MAALRVALAVVMAEAAAGRQAVGHLHVRLLVLEQPVTMLVTKPEEMVMELLGELVGQPIVQARLERNGMLRMALGVAVAVGVVERITMQRVVRVPRAAHTALGVAVAVAETALAVFLVVLVPMDGRV